ncbi:hypothetical protein ACJX0J_020949, partial [Zea mays]
MGPDPFILKLRQMEVYCSKRTIVLAANGTEENGKAHEMKIRLKMIARPHYVSEERRIACVLFTTFKDYKDYNHLHFTISKKGMYDQLDKTSDWMLLENIAVHVFLNAC